jgi:hypothetical protein
VHAAGLALEAYGLKLLRGPAPLLYLNLNLSLNLGLHAASDIPRLPEMGCLSLTPVSHFRHTAKKCSLMPTATGWVQVLMCSLRMTGAYFFDLKARMYSRG